MKIFRYEFYPMGKYAFLAGCLNGAKDKARKIPKQEAQIEKYRL
jgi:hypothetical protein